MFYALLKIPARLALWLYCRHIRINHPAFLKLKGPMLVAANHPNSFLDAIILHLYLSSPFIPWRGAMYLKENFLPGYYIL